MKFDSSTLFHLHCRLINCLAQCVNNNIAFFFLLFTTMGEKKHTFKQTRSQKWKKKVFLQNFSYFFSILTYKTVFYIILSRCFVKVAYYGRFSLPYICVYSWCRDLLWVCRWSRWCRGWTMGPQHPPTQVHTHRQWPPWPRPTTRLALSPRGSEQSGDQTQHI